MSLTVFPSIHIDRGKVVHLVEDQVVPETGETDPLAVALKFQAQGASWVHLVAVSERLHDTDLATVVRIVGSLRIGVQALFCSVTDDDTLRRALRTGCARLNLGSAALSDPDWCARVVAEHGDRLGVSALVRTTPQGPASPPTEEPATSATCGRSSTGWPARAVRGAWSRTSAGKAC
ncbi:HisA/HisF-related TIM barrel protein [Streptoverticillium reticulum]|uniref:HisA/HisF-related TIM barrel protein n=1 Tax=Streptoverticillium reticulum TaxID=1433415 RepID=UPI0039BFAF01